MKPCEVVAVDGELDNGVLLNGLNVFVLLRPGGDTRSITGNSSSGSSGLEARCISVNTGDTL